MSIAGEHGAGYAKVSSRQSRGALHKKKASLEARSGTKVKWIMSKKADQKQTEQLLRNIKASHLYPMARVASVELKTSICPDGTVLKERRLIFDTKCSSNRLDEVKQWIVILNGDGAEAAQVIEAMPCEKKGLVARVPNGTSKCSWSNAKLKGALICFGPQPVPRDTHDHLLENSLRFPKARRAMQVLPDTFARLQRLSF
jgi:hypothetical protein